MNKFRSLLLFCMASISIVGFTHVYAGNRPGAISLTLGGGYDYFSSKRLIQNTGTPLGILGYDFTNSWGFEALYGAFSTKFNNSVGDSRQIRGSLLLLDGVYHFITCTRIEPFITAGTGITTLNPNRNDANNEANVNLGLGVELFASKSIALRLDARDLYTIVGGKNDVLVDAGVTFLFDTK